VSSAATIYPRIRYAHSDTIWLSFPKQILEIIDCFHAKKICEFGAGANPTLSRDAIVERSLDFTALDISPTELAKASPRIKDPYRRYHGADV
jgi:hypothetical protein